MLTNVYTIRDKLAEESGPIFTAKSDAVAIRSALNSISEFPLGDFELLQLGTFNTETSELIANPGVREINLILHKELSLLEGGV